MKKYIILTMEIVYCYEQMPEEQLCLAARAAGLGTSPKPDHQPQLEHGNCRRLVAFYRCYCTGMFSSFLTSDFSLTNSRATSSFVRCDRMRSTVQPVSSMLTLRPRGSQHAQLPCSMMSRNCITATPTSLSSRAKQ